MRTDRASAGRLGFSLKNAYADKNRATQCPVFPFSGVGDAGMMKGKKSHYLSAACQKYQ
ncbi:hypothetical protein [Xaviernesmea oryzae]|uniref:hypothetical protein n=1 Tax=Xaviernesmea oryzae TaxID=464029 RepID=UPI0013564920|nr:hypothetical protein [Xaviernesmea oryzae]